MDQRMLPLIIEVLIQEYAPLQDISTSYIKKLSLARSGKLEKPVTIRSGRDILTIE